jgi:predicted GNAT family N-acyltransferase
LPIALQAFFDISVDRKPLGRIVIEVSQRCSQAGHRLAPAAISFLRERLKWRAML